VTPVALPDLGDELMYPRLSDAKIERLAKSGERRSFEAGDTPYRRAGPRPRGRPPAGRGVIIAKADSRTFLGDIACHR
jgi:thioredoxin reductase (NADPH)